MRQKGLEAKRDMLNLPLIKSNSSDGKDKITTNGVGNKNSGWQISAVFELGRFEIGSRILPAFYRCHNKFLSGMNNSLGSKSV